MTFCATCSPQASCWVAVDLLLAGPERALCGGRLTVPSLEAVGLSGLGATSCGGLPRGANSTRLLLLWPGLWVHSGYIPKQSRASSAPFPGGGGFWPSIWSHFPRLTLAARALWESSSDPSSPQAGGQSRLLSGSVAPLGACNWQGHKEGFVDPSAVRAGLGWGTGPFHLSGTQLPLSLA